jgi:MFS family permease
MFVGAFIGSGVFGFVCDRLGRKRPLFAATALVVAAMFASLAAPSFWVIAALRIVTGFGAAGQSHTIFLLTTEPVGPAYRCGAGLLTASCASAAQGSAQDCTPCQADSRLLLSACAHTQGHRKHPDPGLLHRERLHVRACTLCPTS